MTEDREPLDTALHGAIADVVYGKGGFVEIYRKASEDIADFLRSDAEPEGVEPEGAEPLKEPGAGVLTELSAAIDDAMAEHAQKQRRWPVRTDGERLTRAFRALDESGIVAREDFTCCGQCARDALRSEVAAHDTDAGPAIRGYVYYHAREAARAAVEGGLWLGFDAVHEIRRAAVGEEIAETLRAHGLTVTWNGDPDTLLAVELDGRWRRWGRRAAYPGSAIQGEPSVEVAYTNPSPYPTPEWVSHYEGRVTVRELARMVLPWLPGDFTATMTSDRGDTVVVERAFDVLRVRETGRVLPRERVEEPLSRWAVGGVWPEEDAASSGVGMVDASYQDTSRDGIGSVDVPEPLETAAARALVHHLTPAPDSFAVFVARDGSCVQMMWHAGPRLWMETPEPEASLSRGRFVSVSEADEMVRVLAEEGRIALDELGELSVLRW
ncbi:hypothetical protein KIK06_28040 [Nocardiopsis sp. EMB25]|uniref:DUF6891 domain-containing protein n=1 Tax=Nocardiopsis TaxID=2013 RepID=UPI00034CB38C|nr:MULTISPECIES: hypothetical protein [Nocardiopsis]MCY9787735.1 hypothetical protein [Nocardiopsis sp. EMB25]